MAGDDAPGRFDAAAYDEAAAWFGGRKFAMVAVVTRRPGGDVVEFARRLRATRRGLATWFYAVDARDVAVDGDYADLLAAAGAAGLTGRDARREAFYFVATRQPSAAEAATWYDRIIDLVFLDVAFDYETAQGDIAAWMPKVRRGGVICGAGHGDPRFPGVTRAVDEAFGAAVVVRPPGLWWVQRG